MSRVSSARTGAAVCTAMGLAAMMIAPAARSETPVHAPPAAVEGEARPPVDAPPEPPGWVSVEGATGQAFVFPPASAPGSARPVTVLLHGMCGEPVGACGPFVDVSTSRGWLVCPKAEDRCGAGTRWRVGGTDDARLVEASVRALGRDHPGRVDLAAPRLLVGFSLGGVTAVHIVEASTPHTYDGLVVIASIVHPDPAALLAAGVKRVVLAAGDLDMTSVPLQQDARRMEQQGLPTRFVSLGRFGHGYPADMEQRMRAPMEWVAGGAEVPGPGPS